MYILTIVRFFDNIVGRRDIFYTVFVTLCNTFAQTKLDLVEWLFSTLCDNFCLWNREMLTEKDFYDYFAEETISIGFVSTHKPEEPLNLHLMYEG
jgi:hypothetical protein